MRTRGLASTISPTAAGTIMVNTVLSENEIVALSFPRSFAATSLLMRGSAAVAKAMPKTARGSCTSLLE